jgi:hypothetical protein
LVEEIVSKKLFSGLSERFGVPLILNQCTPGAAGMVTGNGTC